jgi:hypothetical protein
MIHNETPGQDQNSAKNEHENPNIDSSIIGIENPQKETNKESDTSNHKNDEIQKSWFERNKSKWEFFIMTAAILTFIVYIYVSFTQINQTNEAIKSASDAANKTDSLNRISDSLSVKAINIADSSMKTSAKIAEMQEYFTKKELRAYIGIVDIHFEVFQSGKEIIYDVGFTNTGKTPAYEIMGAGTCKTGGTGVYDNEICYFNEPIKGFDKDIKSNGLSGTFIISTKILTTTDSTLIKSGEINCFVYGVIFYKDIFREQHRVRFCRYYSTSGDFLAYKRYNDEY